MKNHYGQFRFPIMSASTHGKLHMFDPALYSMFLAAANDSLFGPADKLNVQYMANAEYAIYQGAGLHIFVDPDTEQIVRNASSKLEDEDIIKYVPKIGLCVVYRAGKTPFLYYRAKGSSIVEGADLACMRYEDGLDSVWSVSTDESYMALVEQARFAHGLFMLMECFPESFSEGLPEDQVRHPNWYRKLKCSKVCIKRISRTVCPHIRSGHFRMLKSGRFTRKRGQVVFVKPSMVHGDAIHSKKRKPTRRE